MENNNVIDILQTVITALQSGDGSSNTDDRLKLLDDNDVSLAMVEQLVELAQVADLEQVRFLAEQDIDQIVGVLKEHDISEMVDAFDRLENVDDAVSSIKEALYSIE